MRRKQPRSQGPLLPKTERGCSESCAIARGILAWEMDELCRVEKKRLAILTITIHRKSSTLICYECLLRKAGVTDLKLYGNELKQ